jgi:hypothetical protein
MSTPEKPLVEVKVTNPVTYLKNWWSKVMGKEGIDFSFRIHPLTAMGISAVIALGAFGAGRYSLNIPFLKYLITPTTSPAPTAIGTEKDTAYTGTLQFSQATGKYYLMTSSAAELITLEVPGNIDLKDSVGKRILAIGKYNKTTRILIVADAKSLEVLPKNPVTLPTAEPTPSPSPEPSLTPTPEATPSATP